jgi:hypothetical protein
MDLSERIKIFQYKEDEPVSEHEGSNYEFFRNIIESYVTSGKGSYGSRGKFEPHLYTAFQLGGEDEWKKIAVALLQDISLILPEDKKVVSEALERVVSNPSSENKSDWQGLYAVKYAARSIGYIPGTLVLCRPGFEHVVGPAAEFSYELFRQRINELKTATREEAQKILQDSNIMRARTIEYLTQILPRPALKPPKLVVF